MKLSAFFLAAGLAAAAFPALAQIQVKPVILGGATVSSLMTAECQSINYEPVPVYQNINGKRLGTLKLDKPELARIDQSSCESRPSVFLHLKSKAAPIPADTLEVSYGESALVVVRSQVVDGTRWVRGKAGTQYYWMPVTPAVKYQSLDEDLVQGVEVFEEVCTQPGECMTAPASFRTKVEEAGNLREDTCYNNAYELMDKKRGADGRLYYHLELAGSLQGQALKLPTHVWVPAWTKTKRWTGFFFARGC